jgi:hypothetical protein
MRHYGYKLISFGSKDAFYFKNINDFEIFRGKWLGVDIEFHVNTNYQGALIVDIKKRFPEYKLLIIGGETEFLIRTSVSDTANYLTNPGSITNNTS